jgi:hypothetical protein
MAAIKYTAALRVGIQRRVKLFISRVPIYYLVNDFGYRCLCRRLRRAFLKAFGTKKRKSLVISIGKKNLPIHARTCANTHTHI